MTSQDSLATELLQKTKKDLLEAAEKSSIPDPVNWIHKNFYIPETRNDPELRGLIRLEPYQQDVLREALSRNENGEYKYSLILWSDIKKSIKSCIAAAVNLYRVEYSEWGEYYIIANDLKQANSRVSHYIRRAITLNPRMNKQYKRQGYRITAPNGSFIEAIPIDPSGEAGSNADQVTFSELWGAYEDAKQHMWSEMTLSPTKYGQSFRWVESYAGFIEESELLYSLYEMGTKAEQGAHLLWPDRLYAVTDGEPSHLELYANESARMLCLWNTVPRCTWQHKNYYASEERTLLPNEFRRMHRNQWVANTDTFVPMEWVYSCKRNPEEWPEIDQKRHPVVISMDAATTNDCFGIFMGCRHPSISDEVLTLYARKWKPGSDGKINFQGTDDEPGPERELRRLIKEYNVVQVCFDPNQLHDMATRLSQEYLAWFKRFNQGPDRLRADSQFRDLIRDRRFWHRGEPDLIEHIQNADAMPDKEDRKLRIVKRVDRLKVDLAVAASMCCHELLRLNL